MWSTANSYDVNSSLRDYNKTCNSGSTSTTLDNEQRYTVRNCVTSHSRSRSNISHPRYHGANSHPNIQPHSRSDKDLSNPAHLRRQPTTASLRDFLESPNSGFFVGHMTRDIFIEAVSRSLDERAEYNAMYVRLPTYIEPESVFFSVSRPDIPTKDYITRLVTYTQCSASAFVVMLIYLDRIATSNPNLLITPFNMHRLLVTALTLACKVLDDRCFSNVHYAKVGGIPTVREMNRLELQFLTYLNFRLHVTLAKYEEKVRRLETSTPTSPISVENAEFGSPVTITSTMGKDEAQSIFSSGTTSTVSISNEPRQTARMECTYGPGARMGPYRLTGHSGHISKWHTPTIGHPPPSLLEERTS